MTNSETKLSSPASVCQHFRGWGGVRSLSKRYRYVFLFPEMSSVKTILKICGLIKLATYWWFSLGNILCLRDFTRSGTRSHTKPREFSII